MPLSFSGWEGERVPMTRKSGDRSARSGIVCRNNLGGGRVGSLGLPDT